MPSVNQLTVIFLGSQGSGKGTQLKLVKDFLAQNDPGRRIVHVEMGKLLRDLQEKENYTGRRTKELLMGGNLIPYAISTARFSEYLVDSIIDGTEHLLIDGFPRTFEQIPTLDSAMDFFNRDHLVVINLLVSSDEAVRRLLPRGRDDDTEEGIRKRLAWSAELSRPNMKWFKENPKYRVIEIDGERSVEEIHRDIRAQLGL